MRRRPTLNAIQAFWREHGAELLAVRRDLYDQLDALIRADERYQVLRCDCGAPKVARCVGNCERDA